MNTSAPHRAARHWRGMPLFGSLVMLILGVALAAQLASLKISSDALELAIRQRELDKAAALGHVAEAALNGAQTRAQQGAALLHNYTRLKRALAQPALRDMELRKLFDDVNDDLQVRFVEVVDTTENIIFRMGAPELADRTTAWGVAEALAGEAGLASERIDGTVIIRSTFPVKANGVVVGAVTAGVRIDQAFVERLAKEVGSAVALIGRSGLITASSGALASNVEIGAGEEVFRQKIAIYRQHDNGAETHAYLPIQIVDEAYVLLVAIDSSDAAQLLAATQSRSLRWGIGIFVASALVGLAWLAWALRPLVALHRRANDISVGLTGAPVARMTADPIRSIDRAFDEVTGRLVARNEELKTQTQRAEEASAAKSAFLSNMSHEIRTPLNGVLGMVELLRGTALDRKQRQYCDGILASGQGLQGMLNNLLDMAKIESGSMEIDEFDFDPAALAREVAEVYASLAHHGDVQVIADIAPNLPWVEGDAPKVRQILFNLMNNARKFTRKGHIRLTVQAKAQTGDGRHNIEFCVDDTGPGITPTARALLFVPFAQSTVSRVSDQAGSGLGLSICKALTDKMGGSILVDTKLGRGTRIVVTIPFSPARHVPDEYGKLDDNVPGGVTAAVPSPGHVAPRVLIVEDNEVNREVISAMLERLGVATDVAVDGSQAVGKVGSQQYDLVFMDCRMPIMDGFEATRAIRAMPQGRGLPIVALTANAFTDDREQCIAAGMDDFLSKPTSISKISAMLDRYVLSPLGEREPMGATIIATPAAGEQSTPAMRGVDLDHSALDALRELERSGAKGVVSRIVNAYLEAVPPLINLALAGEREHDPKRIANAVHQLKASSLTVGAVGLATVARDIDRACNAGTYEGEPPVAALEVAWRAVEPLLKQTIEADLHQPAPLS